MGGWQELLTAVYRQAVDGGHLLARYNNCDIILPLVIYPDMLIDGSTLLVMLPAH